MRLKYLMVFSVLDLIYKHGDSDERFFIVSYPNWKSQLGFFLLGFTTIYYGVGAIFLLIGIANYALTEIALTDKRIIARISRPFSKMIDLPLNEIIFLNYEQSYWGSKFNYGTVEISCMNGSKKKIKYINDPAKFCSAVNNNLILDN